MFKNKPYNHLLLTNVFSNEITNTLEIYFNKLTEKECKIYQNKNTLLHEYTWIYDLDENITNIPVNYFYNHKFIKKLENYFNKKGIIVDMNFWGGGFMRIPENHMVEAHIDYTINSYLGLKRFLTGIYFLNNSDCQLILENDNNKVTYDWIKNNFVIFENTENSWHSVSKNSNNAEALRFIYYTSDTENVIPRKSIYK
jgi:hypothetical protein